MIFRRMQVDLNEMGRGMQTQGTVWATVNRRLTRPEGWILSVVIDRLRDLKTDPYREIER